ncbi:hypothetical protein BUALT_Bualt05G0025400 [Buddleja alternifolia]|uniref:Uncharacterized protein n=1 Tax=Buddleja alternifolia TaxID=168488 RepID=A0AAV6XSF7_9LAMI|nr:hypothetical protein BUALT_Bualt05G0025400 [Buddleja alternifolia]
MGSGSSQEDQWWLQEEQLVTVCTRLEQVCSAGLTTAKDESLSNLWHMRLSQCGEIKLESLAKKSLIPFAKGVSLISCDSDKHKSVSFHSIDEKIDCFHPRIYECNEFSLEQRKESDGEAISCIFSGYKSLGVKRLWDVNRNILRCQDVLDTVEPRVSVPDLAPSSFLLKVCPVKEDCQKDVLEACNISDVPLTRDVEQGKLSPLLSTAVDFGWPTKEHRDFIEGKQEKFVIAQQCIKALQKNCVCSMKKAPRPPFNHGFESLVADQCICSRNVSGVCVFCNEFTDIILLRQYRLLEDGGLHLQVFCDGFWILSAMVSGYSMKAPNDRLFCNYTHFECKKLQKEKDEDRELRSISKYIEIFDSKIWTWKETQDVELPYYEVICSSNKAVSANNSIYWLTSHDNVLAFHEPEGTFQKFPLPEEVLQDKNKYSFKYKQLVEYKGRLGLIAERGKMEEESGKGSIVRSVGMRYADVAGFYNEGIAFLNAFYEVVFYNLEDCSFTRVDCDLKYAREVFRFRSDLERVNLGRDG